MVVKPDEPFVLRVDASQYAVGSALEQFEDQIEGMPTLEQVLTKKAPCGLFLSQVSPGTTTIGPQGNRNLWCGSLFTEVSKLDWVAASFGVD